MSKYLGPALLIGLIVLLAGCSGETPDDGASGRLRIVTTTGMIADSATRIAGEHAAVTALMGPGVDPHLFKASERDVHRLSEADLILYNGLHLEGKMGDILVKLARNRPVVAVSESLPPELLREPPEFAGQYDPHVWFDVSLWAETLDPIRQALSELAPQHAESFAANAEAYRLELEALDRWVQSRIDEIPEEHRVLVTAHDAFGYFGRRYEVEVIGLQGLSTLAEAGLQDVDRVVELVVTRKIPAMFVESSIPRRSIEAVQAACENRGHAVRIGGQLFSDAMGAPGSDEGNYPGMVRHNVNAIVDSLR